MSKMTAFWVLTYSVLLVGSFINPVLGVIGYLFEYYLRPSLNWWGSEIPDLRWNFTIAAVLTFTYFLRRQSLPDIGPARRGPGMCLVALLVVMILVSPTVAVNPSSSWQKTSDYAKLILFHGLVVGTVRTPLAFDAVVGAHMAGATWWGWQVYQNPKRTSGRLNNIGSGDTRGDNGAAAHLLTVLPFIFLYLFMHPDKRMRGLALVAAPFVINAFVLCNSRGGTLGMVVMGAVSIWVSRSGHRLRIAGAGVLAGLALFLLADPQFLARQRFTTDYENDGSAQGRLQAWRGAMALVADNPLGTGGQGFYELSGVYAPDLVERMREKRDPHNTIVLVVSEWGLFGLGLFASYWVLSLRLLAQVRRQALSGIWYYRSVAVTLGMTGLFVAGLFTDRLYAEAPYWMGAFAVALHRLHTHEKKVAAGEVVAERSPETPRPTAFRPGPRPFTPAADPMGRA